MTEMPSLIPQNGNEQSVKLNQPDPNPIVVHPAGEYSIIELRNVEDFPRKIFHKFVTRAMDFIEKYEARTDSVWLGQLLYNAFAAKSPHVLMLIAYDANERLVAHAIVYPEVYPTKGWVGHVLQIEKDVPEPEIIKVGWELIQEWARKIGIKTLVNSTETKSRVRLFEGLGFTQDRYIMKKDIEGSGEATM